MNRACDTPEALKRKYGKRDVRVRYAQNARGRKARSDDVKAALRPFLTNGGLLSSFAGCYAGGIFLQVTGKERTLKKCSFRGADSCACTNALFWVLTGTLVVIVLVVDLALPKELAQQEYRLLTYNAPAVMAEGEAAESFDALKQAVRQGDALGISFGEDGVTIVHPGYSQKTLNAIILELSGIQSAPVKTQLLEADAKEIPFNLRLSPVFICFEAS